MFARPRTAAVGAVVEVVVVVAALLVAWLAPVRAEAPAHAASTIPSDPPRGDVRIAVFGDFNGPYGAVTYPPPVAGVMRSITRVWRPDLLLSPGDVVAGQDLSLPDGRRAAMWQAFDRDIAAPLRAAGVPYAFAMGNHDASSLLEPDGTFRFARDRVAAARYWGDAMYERNLAYLDRVDFPFRYAFSAKGVVVIVLDASSATVDAVQRTWLARLLERPEVRDASLRVVLGHLPLVGVSEGRLAPGESIDEATALATVMREGRVDLYVSGHDAAYYPGRLDDLELLFAGGVGAKPLVGAEGPARSTVTLVDVWYEPLELRYTTFDASTLQVVPASELPLETANGVRLSEHVDREPTFAAIDE